MTAVCQTGCFEVRLRQAEPLHCLNFAGFRLLAKKAALQPADLELLMGGYFVRQNWWLVANLLLLVPLRF